MNKNYTAWLLCITTAPLFAAGAGASQKLPALRIPAGAGARPASARIENPKKNLRRSEGFERKENSAFTRSTAAVAVNALQRVPDTISRQPKTQARPQLPPPAPGARPLTAATHALPDDFSSLSLLPESALSADASSGATTARRREKIHARQGKTPLAAVAKITPGPSAFLLSLMQQSHSGKPESK